MDKEYERVFQLLDKIEELDFQEKTKKVRLGEKEFEISLEKEIEKNTRKSFTTTTITIRKDGAKKVVASKKWEQDINENYTITSSFVCEFMKDYTVETEKKGEAYIDGPYVRYGKGFDESIPDVKIYQQEDGLLPISVEDDLFHKEGNIISGYVCGRNYTYDFSDETCRVEGIDYETIREAYDKITKKLMSINSIYENTLQKNKKLIPFSIDEQIGKEMNQIKCGRAKMYFAEKEINRPIDKWTDFEESEIVEMEHSIVDMIADIKVENMAQDITQKLDSLNECQKKQVLSKIIVKK